MSGIKQVLALCFIFACAISADAVACSCAEINEGNILKPEYIFIGFVSEGKGLFEPHKNEEEYLFKVVESFKGKIGEFVNVKARSNPMACGIGYRANVYYLIFGWSSNGFVRTGACGSFPIDSKQGRRLFGLLTTLAE
ncbi:MAG: hypothetical protein K1563_20855 [Candidatus Thiodiazotropha sp. (ex. Lucinisca nassula)]|nr:hypothetical protein [Candidatus Thiodiazotropha sp. (ex. Lucinisca nassula)]MBW9276133.1 hypothetical protein [Candidatus Thiodiazotropha sp. (ex. Lucinisca nassula)]